MGCYMSSPDKRVFVSDGEGKDFIYATASCQGWRRDQEDAEKCIPYFDKNASLFILCDGHGGAEVAKYTVEHLPDFIKNHPLYKEGKYEEALETAFIEFDALIGTSEGSRELCKIALDDDLARKKLKKASQNLDEEPSGFAGASSSKNDNGIVEDIDADTLRREAQLPLSSVLEKYNAVLALTEQSRSSRVNASPVIRAPRDEENEEASLQPGTSSSAAKHEPTQGPSHLNTPVKPISKDLETSKPLVTSWPAEGQHEGSDSDSGSDFLFKGESSSDEDGDGNDDGDDEDDNEAGEGTSSGPKKIRRKKHKRPLDDDSDTSTDDDDDDDDDEDDDDDDEDEDDPDSGSSEIEGSDDDEELDEEADDHSDDTLYEPRYPSPDEPGYRGLMPGMTSGCTVVVALVKDGKIYVASAGDSRCILVMRNGECKPMSFDHKPEDAIERKRIAKAGGRVIEGRVNGGLNLSRALGDFNYKDPSLDAKSQMITPCPDVKTADLDPNEVEYIFLACDGIWNSMKNQQAARFIRKATPTSKKDLVNVCVQLFRCCIAPETDGDGTGCDNMTCIIAKFIDPSADNSTNNDLKKEVEAKQEAEVEGENATSSHKRSTSDDNESNDMPTKRRCLRL